MVLSDGSTRAWWERKSCATLVGPNFGPIQGQSRCSRDRDGRVAWPSRVEPEQPYPNIQASLTYGGQSHLSKAGPGQLAVVRDEVDCPLPPQPLA